MSSQTIIPVSKLQNGFDDCVKHIKNLITSSELLYSNGLYPAAFSLTVLAIEEDAKLGVIQEHIRDSKPITHSEWQELTRGGSHRLKLIMQLQKERIKQKGFSPEKYAAIKKFNEELGIHTLSFEALQRDSSQDYSNFQHLDGMKQDCFYLGWRNDNWLNFYSMFTVEEQEAMTWLLLKQARSWLLTNIIANKYPNPVQATDMPKLKQDPILVEFIELKKGFGTPTFFEKSGLASKVWKKYRQSR